MRARDRPGRRRRSLALTEMCAPRLLHSEQPAHSGERGTYCCLFRIKTGRGDAGEWSAPTSSLYAERTRLGSGGYRHRCASSARLFTVEHAKHQICWHPDPSISNRLRYWNGRRWSGWVENLGSGRGVGRYSLQGWRRLWFQRLVRFPAIFYPLAWFNCSVPITRGRLDRLMRPAEGRYPHPPPPPDTPPTTGVREPRRPSPSAPSEREHVG